MVSSARGTKGGRHIFRIDAFLVFLGISVMLTVVLRTVYYRFKKWAAHVKWMQGLVGGTLIADAEADYWLNKIKQANYRPIWRWYYGKAWNTVGAQTEATLKKRSVARKLGYVNVLLVASIVLVLVFGTLDIRFVPEIPLETNVTLLYYTDNLLPVAASLGWLFEVRNATGGWYEGELVGFIATVERTDGAFVPKNVALNVKSQMCIGENDTEILCVAAVVFALTRISESTSNTTVATLTNDTFSVSLRMEKGETFYVSVVIALASFDSDVYQNYFVFASEGSELESYISVSGGYYRVRPRGE